MFFIIKERCESVLQVELSCRFIDRIHFDSPDADLIGELDHSSERVEQQETTKPASLLRLSNRQSAEQCNRNINSWQSASLIVLKNLVFNRMT